MSRYNGTLTAIGWLIGGREAVFELVALVRGLLYGFAPPGRGMRLLGGCFTGVGIASEAWLVGRIAGSVNGMGVAMRGNGSAFGGLVDGGGTKVDDMPSGL